MPTSLNMMRGLLRNMPDKQPQNNVTDRGKAILAQLSKEYELAEKRGIVLSKMLAELQKENMETERVEGFYSSIVSWELEDFIESRNWFSGVIFSASILDDIGKRKLKRNFKGKINPKKIDNLQLEQTIMLLLASGLIDQITYERMLDVKNLRNDLAHDSIKTLFCFLNTKGNVENKATQRSRAVIKKAIKCIEKMNPKVSP